MKKKAHVEKIPDREDILRDEVKIPHGFFKSGNF